MTNLCESLFRTASRGKPDRWPYLTIKNMIKAVLGRCHWGKDNCRLQVENLPKAPPLPGQMYLLSVE